MGKIVLAIGWGSYADDYNHDSHNHEQQAFFKILDSEEKDKEDLLCPIGRKRVTCFGDSG